MVAVIASRGGTDFADMSALSPFVDEVRAALRQTWDRDTFDYLIDNAGIAVVAVFADTSEAAFDELLKVDFEGVFFLT